MHDVVVVGSGPTGLMLAGELALAGVDAVVVDGAAVFADVGSSAWHVDRIHPSPGGHRALAEAALGALEPVWARARPVTQAPPPPRAAHVALWLAVNGVPWAARRSRDLIPQVAQAVTHELLEDRRARLRLSARA